METALGSPPSLQLLEVFRAVHSWGTTHVEGRLSFSDPVQFSFLINAILSGIWVLVFLFDCLFVWFFFNIECWGRKRWKNLRMWLPHQEDFPQLRVAWNKQAGRREGSGQGNEVWHTQSTEMCLGSGCQACLRQQPLEIRWIKTRAMVQKLPNPNGSQDCEKSRKSARMVRSNERGKRRN